MSIRDEITLIILNYERTKKPVVFGEGNSGPSIYDPADKIIELFRKYWLEAVDKATLETGVKAE